MKKSNGTSNLEKTAKRFINEMVLEDFVSYENVLSDYDEDSEEYVSAKQILSTPREELVTGFATTTMHLVFIGKLEAGKFFGYETIESWVSEELKKQGY